MKTKNKYRYYYFYIIIASSYTDYKWFWYDQDTKMKMNYIYEKSFLNNYKWLEVSKYPYIFSYVTIELFYLTNPYSAWNKALVK